LSLSQRGKRLHSFSKELSAVLGPKLDDAFFAHEFHTLFYFRAEIFDLWSSVQSFPQSFAVASMRWQCCNRFKADHALLFRAD
jgi:hypothetical protein